jgi:ABC-type transport system involved in Fe-S cluster assembly fused permease/ATPase subunit
LEHPTFPPYLNENYKGLDPIASFDFHINIFDNLNNEWVCIGKSLVCDYNFDGFGTFNWSIKQGIIDSIKFQNVFGIEITHDQRFYAPSKQPDFYITFQCRSKEKPWPVLGYYNLAHSIMSTITLGIMPGKRIAVIELTGTSKSLIFNPNSII